MPVALARLRREAAFYKNQSQPGIAADAMDTRQRQVRRAHFTNPGELPQTVCIEGRCLRPIQVARAQKLLREMAPRFEAQPVGTVYFGRFNGIAEILQRLDAVAGIAFEQSQNSKELGAIREIDVGGNAQPRFRRLFCGSHIAGLHVE